MSSSSEVSLLQMPEDPMKHILEHLEFRSILILRKVCHELRNFIDDSKPSSRLTRIDARVNPECISFVLESKSFHENKNNGIYIDYEKKENGILLVCNRKKTIIEDADFVSVFCKDFDIVLRYQKTLLEDFRININLPNSICEESKGKVLGNINKTLKSMNDPLQVKSFYMQVIDHNGILSVLPNIKPNSLKEIHISDYSARKGNMLNIDEIGQLEQWKQAKQLTIRGFRLPYLPQNIIHFSKIVLYYQEVSIEELILLKEIFLCSPTLHTMKIVRSDIEGAGFRQTLIEAFGQQFLNTREGRKWFFRVPDTDQFLEIKFRIKCITFNRIEQSDVPQNARILN